MAKGKTVALPSTALQDLREAPDKQSTVDFIRRLYDEEKKRKRPFAIQWYHNIAYVAGHQWANISPLGQLVKVEDIPAHRVYRTENEIAPRVKRIVSKATVDPPIMECVPTTLDEADQNSATAGSQFLLYHQYEQDFPALDMRCLIWAVVGSKGFYKTMWDPLAGPLVERPKTEIIRTPDGPLERPVFDDDGIPAMDRFNLGEIEVEVCSPFEVFPIGKGDRISAPGIVGMLHVVHRSVRHIKAVYGVTVDPEEQLQDTDDVYRDMMEQLGTLAGGNQSSTERRQQQEPTALVYEYWEKPSESHPKGRLIVVAGNEVLKNDDLPYDHNDLPFAEIEEFPLPGRFWPLTIVEQSIPIQRQINVLASKIEEHLKLMVFPKIIRYIGDGIEEPWTNEAGQEITCSSRQMKPDTWSPDALPQDIYHRTKMLREHLDDLFSTHEASRGQVPSGVKSGVALAFLLEQDDTQHGPLYRSYHRARERVGRQIIALAKQFYDEKRKIRILGENQAWVVIDFDKSDLAGVADVRVRQRSAVPMSRAGAMQQAFDIAQAFPNFYIDPQTGQLDKERLAEDMQLGSVRKSLHYDQIDIEQAKRENERMTEGLVPNPALQELYQQENPQSGLMPNTFDNHMAHYREHARFMKTAEYDALPVQSKIMMIQHLNFHQEAITQAQAAQQRQAPVQGGQPQPQGATA